MWRESLLEWCSGSSKLIAIGTRNCTARTCGSSAASRRSASSPRWMCCADESQRAATVRAQADALRRAFAPSLVDLPNGQVELRFLMPDRAAFERLVGAMAEVLAGGREQVDRSRHDVRALSAQVREGQLADAACEPALSFVPGHGLALLRRAAVPLGSCTAATNASVAPFTTGWSEAES